MPSPEIARSDEPATSVVCDALVLSASATSDGATLHGVGAQVDAALDGYLLEHLQEIGFKARVGDVAVVPTFRRLPAKSVAVVGVGNQEPAAGEIRRAAAAAARRLSDRSVVASALHDGPEEASEASVEGFLLGSYSFTAYKSDPHPSKLQRVLLLDANERALERGRILAEATLLARDLTNEPAATLSPDALGRRAREIADVNGLECRIFDENDLRERGFGGLLGVGAGSQRPPRLIQLRHAPSGARRKVVLVGKGITFDSGGLSLKDAKGMEQMKTDKAGAAAVIGALSAIARLGPPIEVIGLVAASENMPSGDALKPGDVIRHYGGRTSEVLNTDAEGRLVLADALAFACEQDPDAIVDAATLTGSIIIALGTKTTGLFSNDERLGEELRAAADAAGERVWPMPLFEDYRSELDSEVADIKNIGTRYGGSIFGALFLKEFVREGIPWAHLDIAGTARSDSDRDVVSKGGTGVAARTLVKWVEARART